MRLLLLFLCCTVASGEDLDADRTFQAGTHRLRVPLRVTADGVTLELGEAVFEGAAAGSDPDAFDGLGLVVEGRKGVTIRGGKFRGLRCAILVRDCEEVVLEGVDVSGNFRQRLGSTPEREDGGDWLWPHRNDEQQWRRNYGAGICLENCRRCVVRECVGRHQQNGLLLDRSEECEVYDNDMSFNSGWGCALWRSSRNVVARNSFDWCVRGYSHGVYDRGQDSAGILVFEQCNDNVFYRNSATHGGDGFFLYAGHETTQRTGRGGCNGNLVANNDFSHAVANAIEATFSTGNRFIGNRCDDSNYGVWAGYSYGTLVEGNRFGANTVAGVAIEHGQDNRIVFNTFRANPRGVWLWWDDDEELLAGPFGRARDRCPSRGCLVAHNFFEGDEIGVFLRDASGVQVRGNHFGEVGEAVRREGECPGFRLEEARLADLAGTKIDTRLPGKRDAFLPAGHPRGRRHILVGEWGPLDPSEPQVFPRECIAWDACVFHIVGPAAAWDVHGLPEGLRAEKRDRKWDRSFRVTGDRPGLTSFRCEVVSDGRSFTVGGVLLRARWDVRHWAWSKDPREHVAAWAALLATPPVHALETGRLDFRWGGDGPGGAAPADRFATRAATTLPLPAGRYEIRTMSDDGVRVRIDGRIVQEDWTWHAPKENRTVVELEAGDHEIVVEHFEIDGHAVLRFDLRPAP